MKITEGPRLTKSGYNPPALYVQVQGTLEEVEDDEAVLALVREPVAAAGFDPDGKGKTAYPAEQGTTSRVRDLWFFEPLEPQA